LATVSGVLALLLAVGSYLAVGHTPWVAPLYDLFPPSVWIGVGIGGLLGVFACMQGLLGLLHRLAFPYEGGIILAVCGIAAGGLAILTAWATVVASMNFTEC
jgi:hypothetical protein